MDGFVDAIADMISRIVTPIIIVFTIIMLFWAGRYLNNRASDLSEIELRLINLEELHQVTIENKTLSVEHVTEPTSCTVTYIKIPMDKWYEFEHLFGR